MGLIIYNFCPKEHSREPPFFLMFGHDQLVPLNPLLKKKVRYLGTDKNMIS